MTPTDLAEVPLNLNKAASSEKELDPCVIVIFGASGDLARRKLMPALYELASHKSLGRRFAIIGFARTKMTDEAFQASIEDALRKSGELQPLDEATLKTFVKSCVYNRGDYHDPEAYKSLTQRMVELDRLHDLGGNRLFYLATPPEIYPVAVEQMAQGKLARPASDKSWVRIVIEKPFGRDLASARKLNQAVLSVFDESQVYRIDHYLGKDTVQNLLVLRFGNGIFEPLWNRNYVDSVQITAAETLGVEQRAAFYETAGALRDMIQSHVLQLVSLVAVEPPSAYDATSMRNEKIKVLQAIRPFTAESVARDVVRGQYGQGIIEGETVRGYREENGVAPQSAAETFVAARLLIDNWRWADVPFYVRSGKRLGKRVSEIAINFRRAPHLMFRGQNLSANSLVLNVQPDEGISLCFQVKTPGQEMHMKAMPMDFSYHAAFGSVERSAYATLLNDCIRGDATLFDRADGVEAAWALVDPILDAWSSGPAPAFPNYSSGSWGPREADELLERDGRHWRKL